MAVNMAAVVSLGADTTGLDKGTASLTKFTAAGMKAEDAANDVAVASKKAGAAARGMAGGGLRNTALQLSQVAQQGAATGNYLQALAIQLPDMAIGFGTFGIMAGVAAGALLPVITNLMGVGEEAASLEDALDSVDQMAAGLKDTLDVLEMSASELRDTFAGAAEDTLNLAIMQANLKITEANAALKEQIGLLDDVLNSFTTNTSSGAYLELMIKKVAAEFGVTIDQARILENALRDLRDAPDYPSQVQALQNLDTLMRAIGVSAADIPDELASALDETITLSREMDAAQALTDQLASAASAADGAIAGAAGSAAILAGNIAAAAAAMSTLNQQQAKEYSGRGGDPRAFMDGGSQSDYESSAGYISVDALIEKYTPKASKGGGGGGGGGVSQVEQAAEAYDNLMRSIDPVLDAQLEAAENQEILDAALAAGVINVDQYEAAMQKLDASYETATSSAEALSEVGGMVGDALIDAAMGGADAMENLIDALKRAVLQAALLGEGPLAGLFGGGESGGVLGMVASAIGLPSFDGGGSTGSGSRSGGLDGKGGFMAMLHPDETVVDHTKGQNAGGDGRVHVTVTASEDFNVKIASVSGAIVAENNRRVAKGQKYR